jgi:hypothetical protein
MSSTIYTYIGRRDDERISHLDLHPMDSLEDPTEHARRLLREHQSCDRVEIWNDETFIAAVSRAEIPRSPNRPAPAPARRLQRLAAKSEPPSRSHT